MKIKLEKIKVKSFVTLLSKDANQTLEGGTGQQAKTGIPADLNSIGTGKYGDCAIPLESAGCALHKQLISLRFEDCPVDINAYPAL